MEILRSIIILFEDVTNSKLMNVTGEVMETCVDVLPRKSGGLMTATMRLSSESKKGLAGKVTLTFW